MVLRATIYMRHSLASWRHPLLLAMALVNPGNQLRLDNGTEQEQFRVDTPDGEGCVLGLGYPLFTPRYPSLSPYTLEAFFSSTGCGIMAVHLCNACWSLVSPFKRCLQFLVSLSYVYDFFFPLRP